MRFPMPHGYSLDRNVPLLPRNTLRVDARAQWLARVDDAQALPALLAEPSLRGLPVLVLGDGSNVLFATPRFEGLVVDLRADRVRLCDEDGAGVRVLADAAFGWDALVDWTLARGLCGLENLALIPGRVGAAPIQNIGAYGVEVGEFIEAVEAFDRVPGAMTRLGASACGFGYRDSVFRRDPERYVVVAVEFRLPRSRPPRTGYAGIAEELAAIGAAGDAGPLEVAEAVRRLRRRKLPDPAVIGNAGSFFKNPVVDAARVAALREQHPALPSFPAGDAGAHKLSAAWLIEHAGWRGHRDGDAGISAQHALVLVNHGTASGAQLLDLARRVADSVERRFGVALEPEPRIVGAKFRGQGT